MSLLLPEAGHSRQLRACNNAGGVHVVQGPLVADGGREVAPLFFVYHEASDAKKSDERQDEKDQYRWRPCGPWSTHMQPVRGLGGKRRAAAGCALNKK